MGRNSIIGKVQVVTDKPSVIRTIEFNSRQEAKVRRGNDGREYYNREGAIAKAKSEIALWRASDQFLDCELGFKVID